LRVPLSRKINLDGLGTPVRKKTISGGVRGSAQNKIIKVWLEVGPGRGDTY